MGLKTQNGEKLSLDFFQNIKHFSKQNSMLRTHSKPAELKKLNRDWQELLVCNALKN